MTTRLATPIRPVAALCLLMLAGFAHTALAQDPQVPQAGLRVPAGDVPFAPLPIPGASSFALYGGMGTGRPTAMTSRLDPATYEVLPHTHAHGYWAMVVQGRMQHWELSEPDQGPILTAGSSWYQPADVPHADLCVGPETCVTLVIFEERADFIPVQ